MPEDASSKNQAMLWILDLDGVIWLGGEPIAGSAGAIDRIRHAGHRVAFVTNNSGPTRAEYITMLAGAGVEASEAELVTSSQAGASLFAVGERVAVVGAKGILEALSDRGVTVVDADDHPAAVIVGRAIDLDHDRLAAATSAIRNGARFVATNSDPTFPTATGLLPGAGALVAYLATASGVSPEVAGKPHRAVADLVRDRFGHVDIMVGDRPDTDGLFAAMIAARFALVLSGVTSKADLPVDPVPELVGADLEAVADQVLAP
ncbi:MAG: HAD-IIA family hydrolase [Actinomycetota bacterium]|nr:HAD-IIA family hydrolase [Actinomycetota bacterium]